MTSCTPPSWDQRLEVTGTKGRAVVLNNRITFWEFTERKPEDTEVGNEDTELPLPWPAGYGPGHPLLIRDFAESILEDRPFLLDGREGVKVSRLLWDFYRSAHEG